MGRTPRSPPSRLSTPALYERRSGDPRAGPLPALVFARRTRGQGHERDAPRAVARLASGGRCRCSSAFLGVLGFSFSLPATRLAVEDLDATFVGLGRAVVAALGSAAPADPAPAPRPRRDQLGRLAPRGAGGGGGLSPVHRARPSRPHLGGRRRDRGRAPGGHRGDGRAARLRVPVARLLAGLRCPGLVAVLAFAATQGAGDVGLAYVYVFCPPGPRARWVTRRAGRCHGSSADGRPSAGRCCCPLPVVAPLAVAAALTGDLSPPPRRHGRLARLRLRLAGEHVPRLLRLVRGPGPRRGGEGGRGRKLAQPVLTLAWSALLSEQIGAATLIASIAVVASVVATQRTRVAHAAHR